MCVSDNQSMGSKQSYKLWYSSHYSLTPPLVKTSQRHWLQPLLPIESDNNHLTFPGSIEYHSDMQFYRDSYEGISYDIVYKLLGTYAPCLVGHRRREIMGLHPEICKWSLTSNLYINQGLNYEVYWLMLISSIVSFRCNVHLQEYMGSYN